MATREDLVAAIASARPGDEILLAPGVYRTLLRFNPTNSGTAGKPVILRARDGLGTAVIDGTGANITVKFSGASDVELRDLEITGGGYHGVFFDHGAHRITIRHNRIYDNHRVRPLDSHAELKGSGGDGRPFDIAIVDNDVHHRSHPPGGNFQGIDCNFCDGFRIEGNYLHDIHSPTAQPYSYYDRGSCIQMKSDSRGTIIARNRIARCNIGIVYGGEGLHSPEHTGGIVKNNLIYDTREMAIAVVNVRGGRIYHNTLFNNGASIVVAPDTRHTPTFSDLEVANNILDRAIETITGSRVEHRRNHVLPTPSFGELFVAAGRRDFRLRGSARPVIDRGAQLDDPVGQDHDGTLRPRGRGYDIGALEYLPTVHR